MERVEIIKADIFDWKAPKCTVGPRYEIAWFDIWNEICGDNVLEMTKLKRRYGKKALWKGCWREWETRKANRKGRW